MKRLTVLILALLLAAGVAHARGMEVKQKVDDYNVKVMLDKNPPGVGKTAMEIDITDDSGRPVNDAIVLVNYSMPGMPGCNYMAIPLLKGATYAATLKLPMAGAWKVTVKITKSGKTSKVQFDVNAEPTAIIIKS